MPHHAVTALLMKRLPRLLVVTCVSATIWAQDALIDQIAFEPIVENLPFAAGVTHAGDGSNRLFISTLQGQVLIWDGDKLLAEPFLDLRPLRGCCNGHFGLFSVAFHPDFAGNGRVFVEYIEVIDEEIKTTISEFRLQTDEPNQLDRDSERVILTLDQPRASHNGGDIHFGPDGYLYLSLGDGGTDGFGEDAIGDADNLAQDMSQLFGKMLRIDVDSGDPYAIPDSNPFVGQERVRPEIWWSGIRSPWRFSFDRETGDIFLGDVGHNLWEEINFQSANSAGGENYGWSRLEGTDCFRPSEGCEDPSFVAPIIQYGHEGTQCSGSVSGGFRYRGHMIPALRGAYVFGDFCRDSLFVASEAAGIWTSTSKEFPANRFVRFGEDEQGELYAVNFSSSSGSVSKIVVGNPRPEISSASPSFAIAGGDDFQMTLVGANFVAAARARWNNSLLETEFIDKNHIQVRFAADDIRTVQRGRITVENPAPGGGVGDGFLFRVDGGSEQPAVNVGGIVNGASFAAGQAIAPGSLVSVFGPRLALRSEVSSATPLPTLLGGATFALNNVAVPQFFNSPQQSNVLIPWELAGLETAEFEARISRQRSDELAVPLATFGPGIFTTSADGAGQAAALISGEGVLAANATRTPQIAQGPVARPAKRGEFLEVFATGLGPVENTPATGAAASANPISATTTAAAATIGDAAANVFFSGLAPGFLGLYQINIEVPADAPSGNAVPLVVSIGGVSSQTTTIAVE